MSNTHYLLKIKDLLKIIPGENSEKLTVLNEASSYIVCQYKKRDMSKYLGDLILVRDTVAKKLIKISKKLKELHPDFKLKVVYGYRHPSIQTKDFETIKSKIKDDGVIKDEEELNEKAHMFVADPRVAGHPTGGAVDITITTSDGNLDMGTKIADYSDEEKIQTFSHSVTKEQKNNRKLLHDLMVSEEFAPFYGEWWHFSYGDLEWACFYKKKSSLYFRKDFNF